MEYIYGYVLVSMMSGIAFAFMLWRDEVNYPDPEDRLFELAE